MDLIIILITLAAGALLWWLMTPSDYQKKLSLIPGPRALPLFGNALQLGSDGRVFRKYLMDLCDKYEKLDVPLFKIAIGPRILLQAYQAETVKELIGSMKNINKPWTYQFLKPYLKDTLLIRGGKWWHARRKLMTPMLYPSNLANFRQTITEHATVFVEQLRDKCDDGPFDIVPYIKRCTLDIIYEIAMGRKLDVQLGKHADFIDAIGRAFELLSQRIKTPWHWNEFIYKCTAKGKELDLTLEWLHAFTQKMVNERLEATSVELMSDNVKENGHTETPSGKSAMCILDHLIQLSNQAQSSTPNNILEEINTILAAGYETTASGLTWTTQHIGCHPDVQLRIFEELNDIFGTSQRIATADDLAKMTYLDCVIKETLRLYPPIVSISRIIDEDVKIGCIEVPKGAAVAFNIKRIHRDPTHWTDPDKFNPDRFTPENSVGRNPYAYLPFSAGPRNCIGQKLGMIELRCVMSTLLRSYKIESVQSTEEIEIHYNLATVAKNGITIKLSKRNI